jgi:hypothetical protein
MVQEPLEVLKRMLPNEEGGGAESCGEMCSETPE